MQIKFYSSKAVFGVFKRIFEIIIKNQYFKKKFKDKTTLICKKKSFYFWKYVWNILLYLHSNTLSLV